MKINVDEEILIAAFRYALGRQTYIVGIVVENILDNWDLISDNFKLLLKKEIIQFDKDFGLAKIDLFEWNKILNAKINHRVEKNA